MKTAEERFFSKVRQDGDCWTWTAGRCGPYGAFWTGEYGPKGGPLTIVPHRWSYTYMRAEIPEGLTLDHLCRNTLCVNPWHMEPVPKSVNSSRAVGWVDGSCRNGHEWNEKNVYTTKDGKNRCRPCRNEWTRQWELRKKSAFSTAGAGVQR